MFDVSQEITAGNTLVREAIQSQNFVAGTSGWQIKANGDAEFSNLIARGSLTGGQVVINGTAYPNSIAFYTNNPAEEEPGVIAPSGSGGNVGILRLRSPVLMAGGTPGELTLSGYNDGHNTLEVDVDNVRVTASDTVVIETNTSLRMSNDFTDYATLEAGIWRSENEAWNNIARVNAWVDFAGARANYYKDGAGRVQLRGQVANGSAALIGTLPVGYRPSQSLEFTMRNVTGTSLCAVLVSNAGAITVTANLALAQANGIRLDSISFPVF